MWGQFRDRWRAYDPYLAALAIYLTSRLVIAWAMNIATYVVAHGSHSAAWDTSSSWYHYLLRWDSGWYLDIVEHGYQYNGDNLVQQPVVFYPLYPLLAKALTIIPGTDAFLALLIVANIAALIAVLLLFEYVRRNFGDDVALLTVAFLSFFPTSLFLSAGYTESLTLLLIVCFFLFLRREQYFVAAVFAGLTLATRSTGLVLLPVIVWELWGRFGNDRRRFISYTLICSVLAASGLWLFMIYLWAAFDSPLAFASNQAAWEGGQGGLVHNFVAALLLKGFFPLPLPIGPFTLDIWLFLLFLALLLVFRKWMSSSLFIFALGILVLPYLTRTGGPERFVSMARYLLLAFPVFIVLARLCANRLWLVPCITGAFAGLLFMYSALYAQWYWAG
ncbi:MAG: glycosyltransferase family 39 protein [Pseudolabrys sp.]